MITLCYDHHCVMITVCYDHHSVCYVMITTYPVVQSNKKLLWLGLGSNSIGAEGTWALCESLKHNTSLLWLGLGGNGLADRGALHLATLFQSKEGGGGATVVGTREEGRGREGGCGVSIL